MSFFLHSHFLHRIKQVQAKWSIRRGGGMGINKQVSITDNLENLSKEVRGKLNIACNDMFSFFSFYLLLC